MRRTRQKKKNNVEYLPINNEAGYRSKKTWNIHDLRNIKPLNPNQELVFHSWFQNQNIYMFGAPGTGKTFLGAYLALSSLLGGEQSQIIIVKSIVPSREIGFTKGSIEEKLAPYEAPYHSIFYELIGRTSTYKDMKDKNLVEFQSTSFLRGITWDNTIVLIDEIQNMTEVEIDTVMSRVGKNSRVICCGDGRMQNDLKSAKGFSKSGFYRSLDIVNRMDEFDVIEFNIPDIVRSGFVRSWVEAAYS